ncbi:MAG: hydrogenase expression/formation protein HypE [Bryobacterales bacterium]|nr:hydrogenase expression/formation protein HypE [Bryobacterales bacterium]
MPECPLPFAEFGFIVMAHGGGGRLMHDLLSRVIFPGFRNGHLEHGHDGAVFDAPQGRIAFTTDSYVVRPLFFPGGDIGKLAVCGTVNDLAMCGARPLALSAGFILEEGFAVESLRSVLASMQESAQQAGVSIVTGDTKVVDRGKGDGIFINTAGVGEVRSRALIGPAAVAPGDAILLSGDLGRHGIAVLSAREGIAFETALESDCALLLDPVMALLDAGVEVHCLRDLTRGGLASALVEIAQAGGHRLEIEEDSIGVCAEVRGASEMLGLDPLYLANEGRFVAFVPEAQAPRACQVLRSFAVSAGASMIGRVKAGKPLVTMRTGYGTSRLVEMFSGEQLPRIC